MAPQELVGDSSFGEKKRNIFYCFRLLIMRICLPPRPKKDTTMQSFGQRLKIQHPGGWMKGKLLPFWRYLVKVLPAKKKAVK